MADNVKILKALKDPLLECVQWTVIDRLWRKLYLFWAKTAPFWHSYWRVIFGQRTDFQCHIFLFFILNNLSQSISSLVSLKICLILLTTCPDCVCMQIFTSGEKVAEENSRLFVCVYIMMNNVMIKYNSHISTAGGVCLLTHVDENVEHSIWQKISINQLSTEKRGLKGSEKPRDNHNF